jgi:hypothetical protein
MEAIIAKIRLTSWVVKEKIGLAKAAFAMQI